LLKVNSKHTFSTPVKASDGRVVMRKNIVTGKSIRVLWLTKTRKDHLDIYIYIVDNVITRKIRLYL